MPPELPRFRLNRPIGRLRCGPGWQLGPEWSLNLRDYDLWFVWAGRGQMQMRTETVTLSPGVCFWMRPGGRYEATQDLRNRLGVTFLHFAPEQTELGFPEPPFERVQTFDIEFLDTSLRRVLALHGDGANEEAHALFRSVLQVLAHEARCATQPRSTAAQQAEIMQRIAAEISENPVSEFSIAMLARRAGYSVDHFSRLFAQHTGTGPREYVIRCKIERARHLLERSNLAVQAIAGALGYEDPFFFSRQFKAVTGQSPLAYRKNTTKRQAP